MALLSGGAVFGEAIPPKVGTVYTYSSCNTRFTISIEILGYPDNSPARCSLMDSGETVWSKMFFATPSEVAISDNGQCIVMTNWGWFDERASRSISIYNGAGELVKEIPFMGPDGFESLKWVDMLAIAPDGSCCAIGTGSLKHALLAVYDCRKAELLWEKEYGFSEAVEAKFSNNGEYILIATNDYYSRDMSFFLLNHHGEVLYQKTIPQNYSWDVPDYLVFKENGREFCIFDINSGKYLVESLPGL